MLGTKRSIVLVAIAVVTGTITATPAAAKEPNLVPEAPVYLSLGDSWAFGFGAMVPAEGGYVPQLHAALQGQPNCLPANLPADQCKQLQLVNLAVGGATTPTLIANQLPDATELLESRNGDDNPRDDVELVTLDIGGNDIFVPIVTACLFERQQCQQTIEAELADYRSDLTVALSALREAAGEDATTVIGTYDNPIATCFLGQQFPGEAEPLAALVLEGGSRVLGEQSLDLPRGLHDIMRDVGDDHGVGVADVYGDLGPEDWVGGEDCLHPDDSGYDKVTDAFLEVLEPLNVDLRARRQELKQKLTFFATATADATLVAAGKKIKETTEPLAANQNTKVEATLKRQARERLEEKFDMTGKAKVKVNGTATNHTGATATDTVTVKLKD